ncbi:hypothetical protein Back11_08710 [Paenibacillus baekrokdamisoli]|uniref:Uncharacterized protein n=1 Tax=Paenibacillus baekrokdamisoli TaxID=1712516 RepID=A0A3G9IMJ5_9BACL|nr:hypothetical protein [Paenibacillus baekrokdamisoli]MBB3067285.1 hypothetical protein [Paenibacillus baekrokdamisoli]BBH19526.1 hypothetical protein Back11_08710 [Paenibacillus baekrokdamisoli]
MSKQNNQISKAEVQTSEFNKMPIPGEGDTEFSAEEAAEVFEEQHSEAHIAEEQE